MDLKDVYLDGVDLVADTVKITIKRARDEKWGVDLCAGDMSSLISELIISDDMHTSPSLEGGTFSELILRRGILTQVEKIETLAGRKL